MIKHFQSNDPEYLCADINYFAELSDVDWFMTQTHLETRDGMRPIYHAFVIYKEKKQ